MRHAIPGIVTAFLLGVAAAPLHAADARADIVNAMHQLAKPGNKIHTSGVSTSNGKTTKTSVDIIMPDHFHLVSDRAEIIVIPEGTWMKREGTWSKLPMDMSRMAGEFTPAAMQESEKNLTDAKFIGEDSINGERAKIYTYSTSMTIMGIKSSSNAKAWISASSGRVIHMESDGSAMGHTTHSVQDISYDNSIVIAPPH